MTRGTFIEFDDDELKELVLELDGAPLRIQINGREALKKGARVIEREVKIDATGHKGNYFGIPGTEFVTDLPRYVSSEVVSRDEAIIGFEHRGSGKLAHIIAYGSVNNAPAYDASAGPRRALPEVLEIFAGAAEESVFGDGKK